MKRLIMFIVALMSLMLAPVTIFAQEVIGNADTLPIMDYSEFFTTFGALVAAIPFVVEFLKNLFGTTRLTPNALILALSWITGIVLTMFGWFFELGFLSGVTWYWALAYGFGASLTANGVADTKIIQWIFSLLAKK